MPFPVEERFIVGTEQKLGVTFPSAFRVRMMADNGGVVETESDDWNLYPFFDTSDRKRLKRTCNDIVSETTEAKQWVNFPEHAVAIGANGGGDQLVFLRNEDGSALREEVFWWDHETGEVEKIADSFTELSE